MTYEELMSLVGGGNPQSASYQDIISGIQSQYRPQTQFAPTTSLLDTLGEQLPEQRGVPYGALLQAQGPRTITPIDISKYQTDSTDTSGMFDGGIGGGVGGDSGVSASTGGAGFTVNAQGVAVANTIGPAAAIALSIATGMPVGLIAQAINAQNVAAANAANAAAAGLAASAISLAIDDASISQGVSDAASSLSESATSLAIDDSSISDGVTDGGGGGDSGTAGVGVGEFANGGLVTMNRLMGSNPMGQDDGYASLQSGEYVIKKNAVDKYGEDFLGLLNSGKLTKKQINSLL